MALIRIYKLQKYATVIVSLSIILIASLIFAIRIATISLPQKYYEVNTKSINDTIRVYSNSYGIPHIVAKNENDVFFALGLVHAEDRLWQMDMLRRTAAGNLSEVFGDSAVACDLLMKAINLDKIAAKIWTNLDHHSKSLIESYTKGVNQYIEANHDRLPFEFDAMNFRPAKWEAVDCIKIQRLLAFKKSVAFRGDLILAQVAERVGIERCAELLPQFKAESNQKDDTLQVEKNSTPDTIPAIRRDSLRARYKEISECYKLVSSAADFFSQVTTFLGSDAFVADDNSWAAVKDKSYKTKALLAMEALAACEMPARWYQCHLTCPDFNVTGATIPGVPIFYTGRNDNIAWSMTSIPIDDTDFFIEKEHPKDPNYYINSNNEKVKFKLQSDTIKVNKKEYPFNLRYTAKSVIISDFLSQPDLETISLDPHSRGVQTDRYCLSFSWTGKETTNDFDAYFDILAADDYNSFRAAATKINVPATYLTFCDIKGNIAGFPVGIVPLRRTSFYPFLPAPNWLQDNSWTGYYKLSNVSGTMNPERAFVYYAGSPMPSSTYTSVYYASAHRSNRIDTLLRKPLKFTARDFQIIQNDVYSEYAQRFLESAIPMLEKYYVLMDNAEQYAFTLLVSWDNIYSPKSIAPVIFDQLLEKTVENTLSDELGENAAESFFSMFNTSTAKINELLKNQSSIWFDEILSASHENANDIIYKSFKESVAILKAKLGNELGNWSLNRLQNTTLRHLFTLNPIFKAAVNIGPLDIGGSFSTLNTALAFERGSRIVNCASTLRFIADMDENKVYTVIAGGSSGESMSANYSDQVQIWLNGGYLQVNSKATPDESFKLRVLLKPAK